jgi:hypothetical protein
MLQRSTGRQVSGEARPSANCRGRDDCAQHVDYWNHLGWKDPHSAHFYSERQSAYGRRFGLDSVYTPQIVVDGATEFVGSNTALADKELT